MSVVRAVSVMIVMGVKIVIQLKHAMSVASVVNVVGIMDFFLRYERYECSECHACIFYYGCDKC